MSYKIAYYKADIPKINVQFETKLNYKLISRVCSTEAINNIVFYRTITTVRLGIMKKHTTKSHRLSQVNQFIRSFVEV